MCIKCVFRKVGCCTFSIKSIGEVYLALRPHKPLSPITNYLDFASIRVIKPFLDAKYCFGGKTLPNILIWKGKKCLLLGTCLYWCRCQELDEFRLVIGWVPFSGSTVMWLYELGPCRDSWTLFSETSTAISLSPLHKYNYTGYFREFRFSFLWCFVL